MRKNRRYQGIWPLLSSAVVLMILGLGFLGYYLTHFGANQLFSQEKIVNQKVKAGNFAVQVIYIHPKSVPIDEHGTTFYVIGYADKDNRIGYIGLEASPKDKGIKRLYQAKDTLIDEPHRLEVEVLSVDKHFKTTKLATLSKAVLRPSSALGQELDQTRIASLALAKAHRNRAYLITLILLGLGLGLGLVVWSYRVIARNAKTLAMFYDLYPEMDNSLDKAKTYANFMLEQYDIIIYQNHLLTYSRDICLLDLREVSQLKQRYKTVRQNDLTISLPLPLIQVTDLSSKSQTVRLKKVIPMDLQALWVYLNRYFTSIQTDKVKLDTIVEEDDTLVDSLEIDLDDLD